MNVYIKSFNRPFYLERCLKSVAFNLRGIDRVIVLDDGTLSRYLDRIRGAYPWAEIVSSGSDDGKYQLLREGRFDEIRKRYIEPSRFWIREIEKEPGDRFLLLEDDTWIVRSADIGRLEKILAERRNLICKLWHGAPEHTGNRFVWSREQASHDIDIEYLKPYSLGTRHSAWSIWLVCMAVYEKGFWLDCFRGVRDMTDEAAQLEKALEHWKDNGNPFAFAKTSRRIAYQGWAITGRSDPLYRDLGIKQHIYMDAINELWLEGKIDVLESYPYDFSDEYFLSLIEGKIGAEEVDKWRKWKRGDLFDYNRYYYDDA